ncbi:LysR family transcriptional regulator [Microvirga massiliensis]|uniref:LysR family transcriptional regulator n=1 Tax=Microvirga massiliensis TaxID=1033741 RepID=UPI0007C796D1|nr:LysR family transcriptional regulator [Microvirga massiliensis]
MHGRSERDFRRTGGDRSTNLGDIEIFARVVAAGSMTAAAGELGLAVAAVSKRIQRLEAKLGARLIERTTRRLILTEAGKGFHNRIVRVLEAFEEAVGFASDSSMSLTGTLRITAPTLFGRLHVVPHLPRFLETHSSLEIELDLCDHYVDIVEHGFHLAIRIGDLADSPLIARKLAPMHCILCAAPDYLTRFGDPQDLDELSRHHLLATEGEESWHLRGPDGERHLKARGRLRTNSSEAMREALLAGLGIALRPTWEVGQDLAAGRLRRVLLGYSAPSRAGLFAIFPSKELMPLKVRHFIDFLCETHGPKPSWERAILKIEPHAVDGAPAPSLDACRADLAALMESPDTCGR